MAISVTKGAAATALAAVLSFGTASNSMAGGGDFVGGMIAGGIIGAIVGNGVAHSAPARRVHRPTYDPAVVEYWRTVQSALNDVGIPVGRPDGVPGGRTRSGVRNFQVSIGAEPTGQLDQTQYNELMRQANVAVAMGGGSVNQPAYAMMNTQPYPVAPTVAAPQQGIVTAAAPVVQPMAMAAPVAVTAPAAVAAPVAEAAPAPAAVQVAAAEPTKPADTKVLDILTPAKPLTDQQIDELEDTASVLGVFIGDSKDDALKAFKASVGNCVTSGALTECNSKSDAYTDKASFATTGSGDSESVFYLSRSIDFATPLPRDAIVAKLAETMKPVAEDSDMVIATSPICERATTDAAGDRDGVIGAYARSNVTGAVAMDKLRADCAAYFHAAIPERDGQATGLRVYLFDSRALPPAAATADAKTLPKDLKF